MIKSKESILVFDKDGVITDTENFKLLTLEKILTKEFPLLKDEIIAYNRSKRGMYRSDKIKKIYKHVIKSALDDATLWYLLDEFESAMNKNLNDVNLIPGVKNFILSTKQIKYISSAAPKKEVKQHLEFFGLANEFNGIYASPKYTNKTIALEEIKEKHQLPIIFFGDSLSDYIHASNVNVQFIGVTYCSDVFNNMNGINLIQDFNDTQSVLQP